MQFLQGGRNTRSKNLRSMTVKTGTLRHWFVGSKGLIIIQSLAERDSYTGLGVTSFLDKEGNAIKYTDSVSSA